MEENNLVATLDINKLLVAYDKPEFMKNVFVDYLYKNPEIVAKALGSYVIADLVKTNFIAEISEKVKLGVDKYLEELSSASSYNNPLRQSVNTLITETVSQNKQAISKKVASVISNELTAKTIADSVTGMVSRRIVEVIGELSSYGE